MNRIVLGLVGLLLLSAPAATPVFAQTIGGGGGGGSGTSCTFADPTATIGATAVNGSASTCMRSDAAPALPSTLPALNGSNLTALNGSNISSGTVPAARGGAGTTSGILKANGAGTVSAATSGTDYAPATSGSSILKGNGSGGFSNAASGTDYAPATSGSSILYGNGSGGFSNANVGSGLSFVGGTLSATGGGSGTVTQVDTGSCLTGGPITSTGTISGTYTTNAQTGTTYTVLSSDACKLVTFSNASPVAVTLPQATGSFAAGYSFDVQNKGAGTVTITPTTSTINGASTLTVAQNMGCSIVSDGTNYQVSACTALTPGTAGNNTWTGTQSFGPVQASSNVQSGTTYTIASSDCGKTLLFTNGSAVTVTIAASIAPASGTTCNVGVIQGGAGQVSVNGTAVSAATLVSYDSFTKTAGQGAEIGLIITTVSSTATAYLVGRGA